MSGRSRLAWAAAGCLLLVLVTGCSGGDRFVIMSYNVQNLFDGVSDGTEYAAFDPARGRWDEQRFHERCRRTAEVIRRSVPRGPDLLCLQEVENGRVVEALRSRYLADFGYRYAAFTDTAGAPVNVAVLSRFPLVAARAHTLRDAFGEVLPRDILEVECLIGDAVLYLFVNHWKSKREGERETEASRRASAAVVARRLGEILRQDPAARVVVAGDLNEGADEERRSGGRWPTALGVEESDAVLRVASPQAVAGSVATGLLACPWLEQSRGDPGTRSRRRRGHVPQSPEGSYLWKGAWLQPDHLLLSAGLLRGRGLSYVPGSFSACAPAVAVDPVSGAPQGWNPRIRQRGCSDHLPVIAVFSRG